VLSKLHANGTGFVRSTELSRTHRERLVRSGFLLPVINGWYVTARPDVPGGQSTTWYTSVWAFVATYLGSLKGDDWCLAADQSLSLHAENWTVPGQPIIRSTRARNNVTALPHNTSILDIRSSLPGKNETVIKENLRLYSLPAALIGCTPGAYLKRPTDMRSALAMVTNASQILDLLLEGAHSSVAGRLAGAFRNIGRQRIAGDILLKQCGQPDKEPSLRCAAQRGTPAGWSQHWWPRAPL
jgi:hypothetical protein